MTRQVEDSGKSGLYRLAAKVELYKANMKGNANRVNVEQKAEAFKKFLPILDAFETADANVKPVEEGEIKINADFQEIYKALLEKFESMGLEAFHAAEGDDFVPEFHEAIEQVDGDKAVIVSEAKAGYKLSDSGEILRKAKCVVARPTAKEEEEETKAVDIEADDEENKSDDDEDPK